MRVGISIYELSPSEGSGPGAGVYVLQLLRALLARPEPVEFVVFVNHAASRAGWLPRHPRVQYQVVPLDPARKWTRPVWEQLGFPAAARRLGVDLLHSPFHTCPLVSAGLPVVVTVHDLAYFYYREHYPAAMEAKARYYTWLQPLMLRRARRIITASQFARSELMRRLRLPSEKIVVIPDGPGQLGPLPDVDETQPSTARGVLLAVTSGLLHKNLPRLLEAFAQARLDAEIRLVIVGEIHEQARPRMLTRAQLRQQAEALGIAGRVEISGYVSAEALADLYRRAIAFVFPSSYEGFGLPLLEAMHWGVPVLSARTSALPEVAGEAALYFDPLQPAELARAMEQVVADAECRRALIAKGRERLRAFSWERTAAQTLAVYQDVLNGA